MAYSNPAEFGGTTSPMQPPRQYSDPAEFGGTMEAPGAPGKTIVMPTDNEESFSGPRASEEMGNVESFGRAAGHHLKTAAQAPAQMLYNLLPGDIGPEFNKFMADQEAAYQAEVPDNLGSYTGAFVGDALPYAVAAPTQAGRAVVGGVQRLANALPGGTGPLMQAIKMGAISGPAMAPLAPVTHGDPNEFWSEKGLQTLIGTGMGAAAPLAMRGGAGLLGWGANQGTDIAATIFANHGGAPRIGRDAIDYSLGKVRYGDEDAARNIDSMITALRGGGTTHVPGAVPTSGRILAEAQQAPGSPELGGSLIRLERDIERNPVGGAPLRSAANQRQGAMTAPLAAAAGGNTRAAQNAGIEAAVADRGARTGPLLNAAQTRANEVTQAIPQAQAQMGALDARNTAALRNQGQMQTAASQATASTNPRPDLGPVESRMPSAGVPRNVSQPQQTVAPPFEGSPRTVVSNAPTAPNAGGHYPPEAMTGPSLQSNRAGFTPVEGQPRLPGILSPQNDRAAELTGAADEFGQIAAQSRGEYDAIAGRLQQLHDNGMQPLRSQPLLESVGGMIQAPGATDVEKALGRRFGERIAQVTNADGTIDARDLATIRAEMGRDVRRMMDADPAWDSRKAAGVLSSVKGRIDAAIEQSGGAGWRDALNLFQNLSGEIDQRRLSQGLLDALVNEKGGLTPDAFLNATGRGEGQFIGLHVQAPELRGLSERLGPQTAQHVEGTRNELLRDQKYQDIASMISGNPMEGGIKGEIPRIPFNLSPKAAIINAVTSRMGGGAVEPGAAELARIFQDPQMLANILGGQTAGGGRVGLPLLLRQGLGAGTNAAENAAVVEAQRKR